MRENHLALTVALAILLLMQTLVVPAQTSRAASPLGEVVWPPQERRAISELPDLARRLLSPNASSPTILGVQPIETIKLNRQTASQSEVTIRRQGSSPVTFIQRHEPASSTGDLVLKVSPSDLRTVIEVGGPRYTILVTGPPDSFNVSGTIEEKATSLAGKLAIPGYGGSDEGGNTSRNATANESTPRWNTKEHTVSPFIPLYLEKQACVQGPSGGCSGKATLELACSNCTSLGHAVDSSLDDEFEAAFGGGPHVATGLQGAVNILFDSRDRVVALRARYAFNLNESAVVDPAEARGRVIDDIHERGYRLGDLTYDTEPGASFVGEARLDLELADSRIEVIGAHYVWRQIPVLDPPEEGSDDPYGDEYLANYVQDARTGETLNATFRPASVTSGPDNHLPAPGLALALAAAAAAALAWRRRD